LPDQSVLSCIKAKWLLYQELACPSRLRWEIYGVCGGAGATKRVGALWRVIPL